MGESEEIASETGDVPVAEDIAAEPVVSPDVALQKVSALSKTIELDLDGIFDRSVAALDSLKARLEMTLAKYHMEADGILDEAIRDVNQIKPRIDDLRNKARLARSGEV